MDRSSPRGLTLRYEEPKAQQGRPLWGTQGYVMAMRTPNLFSAISTTLYWEWKMQHKAIFFLK